jgi:hypothetical protein
VSVGKNDTGALVSEPIEAVRISSTAFAAPSNIPEAVIVPSFNPVIYVFALEPNAVVSAVSDIVDTEPSFRYELRS